MTCGHKTINQPTNPTQNPKNANRKICVFLSGPPATLSTCPLEVALMMCWETRFVATTWVGRGESEKKEMS